MIPVPVLIRLMKASSEQGETELSKKLLAVSFVTTLAVIACTAEGPTTPPQTETIQRAEEPVVSATPVPTPVTAPAPGTSSFELTGAKPSTIYVKYTGEASFATIVTFYTSFDDQKTPFGKQSHTVKSGDTVTRVFDGTCIQGDADQEGVKEIGGIFFDINGAPFNPTRNPEKVTECRNQCVPRWEELEAEYGDWEDYVSQSDVEASTQTQGCTKDQRRKKTVRERNTCSRETRIKTETYETRKVEIQCPCAYPEPSFSVSSLTYPAYTPAQTIRYYTFSEVPGDGESASNSEKSAYCVSVGGLWADWGSANDGNDPACKTINKTLSDFDNSGDNDLDVSLQDTDTVAASGGNPISGSATVSGAGAWKLILRAQSGNFQKDVDEETLTCNSAPFKLSVSYDWVGHSSENWTLELYRNNVLVNTPASTLVTNPTN